MPFILLRKIPYKRERAICLSLFVNYSLLRKDTGIPFRRLGTRNKRSLGTRKALALEKSLIYNGVQSFSFRKKWSPKL